MTSNYNSIPFCIICGQSFGNNVFSSKEHIIPEALGNEKIITYNVCKTCNNHLGTHVDSYLTDHFIVKAIRKRNLVKYNDIQLFDDTLQNTKGEKYKIRDDGPKIIPKIMYRDENHVKLIADPKDARKFTADILKNKFKKTPEEIEEILNDPLRYMEGHKEVIDPGVFTQDISLDRSRYLLAAIKMGYEYAFEKIGAYYSEDKIAQKLRAYLYAGRKGKHMFSDDEFIDLSKYCHVASLNPETRRFFSNTFQYIEGATPYLIFITSDMENKLLCFIRILNEDMLSFVVLLSESADMYLKEKDRIITFISNEGALLEI